MKKPSATDCYACGKKESSRCSRCKTAYFCSTTCQKLLYPSHKYVCTREDQSTFYHPPLTQYEAEFLKTKLRNVPVGGRLGMMNPKFAGNKFEEYIKLLTLYRGTFDEIVSAITVGSPTPLPEPQLTTVSMMARYHINSQMRAGPEWSPSSETEKLLGMFSLGAGDLISTLPRDSPPFDRNLDVLKRKLQIMNEFLRALLYYSAMLQHNRETPNKVSMSQVVPSLDRMAAVDTRQFDEWVKYFADGLVDVAKHLFNR